MKFVRMIRRGMYEVEYSFLSKIIIGMSWISGRTEEEIDDRFNETNQFIIFSLIFRQFSILLNFLFLHFVLSLFFFLSVSLSSPLIFSLSVIGINCVPFVFFVFFFLFSHCVQFSSYLSFFCLPFFLSFLLLFAYFLSFLLFDAFFLSLFIIYQVAFFFFFLAIFVSNICKRTTYFSISRSSCDSVRNFY